MILFKFLYLPQITTLKGIIIKFRCSSDSCSLQIFCFKFVPRFIRSQSYGVKTISKLESTKENDTAKLQMEQWLLFSAYHLMLLHICLKIREWSGGAIVLKIPVPGCPTICMIVGQGPIALAVGADGVVGTFLLFPIFSPLFPSLSELVG